MSDRLLKESDVLQIAFQLPYVVNSAFFDAVKALPSADRPQGEWIRKGYWSEGIGMGESYGFYYECSHCNEQVQGGYRDCGMNFCPNCGARMFAKDINVPSKKGADNETD